MTELSRYDSIMFRFGECAGKTLNLSATHVLNFRLSGIKQ